MIRRQIAALTQGSFLLEVPPEPCGLLVGFHGYGETSEDHLEELQKIPGSNQWILVAVQSLHLFYRSRDQQVVGSWMTRQDREAAIENNISYVRSVVRTVQQESAILEPVVFSGFSQGVAMAYRAAACSGISTAGLIALAGDVPPEIIENPRLQLPPVLLGRGLEDPWYTEEKMENDLAALKGRTEVESCLFKGGHFWSQEFLEASGDFLKSLGSQEPAFE